MNISVSNYNLGVNKAFENNEKDPSSKQPQPLTNGKANGNAKHDETHSVTIEEDHSHSNGKDSEGIIIKLFFQLFQFYFSTRKFSHVIGLTSIFTNEYIY